MDANCSGSLSITEVHAAIESLWPSLAHKNQKVLQRAYVVDMKRYDSVRFYYELVADIILYYSSKCYDIVL